VKRRRVKTYVIVNGVTIGIANFVGMGDQTVVEAQLPQSKRLRMECGALWLMAASNALEVPWIKAKLLTVIAGLNQMLNSGISSETPPISPIYGDWLASDDNGLIEE